MCCFFSKKKMIFCILDKKDNRMMPSVVRCEAHAKHFCLSVPKSWINFLYNDLLFPSNWTALLLHVLFKISLNLCAFILVSHQSLYDHGAGMWTIAEAFPLSYIKIICDILQSGAFLSMPLLPAWDQNANFMLFTVNIISCTTQCGNRRQVHDKLSFYFEHYFS